MEAIVKTNFNFKGQQSHYVGKVRDVYSIDGDYLVMVVSDRISAFDVVLPKGLQVFPAFDIEPLDLIEDKGFFQRFDICLNSMRSRPNLSLSGFQ